ncbi:MAG: hypothetical protein Q9183_007304 [Haloplaca sp. 2 TL-2023]
MKIPIVSTVREINGTMKTVTLAAPRLMKRITTDVSDWWLAHTAGPECKGRFIELTFSSQPPYLAIETGRLEKMEHKVIHITLRRDAERIKQSPSFIRSTTLAASEIVKRITTCLSDWWFTHTAGLGMEDRFISEALASQPTSNAKKDRHIEKAEHKVIRSALDFDRITQLASSKALDNKFMGREKGEPQNRPSVQRQE